MLGLIQIALFMLTLILIAVAISLAVAGLPGFLLKGLASRLFAGNPPSLVARSTGLAAAVGVTVILLHFLELLMVGEIRPLIWSLGLYRWSAIFLAVLAATAIAIDYWIVVRPVQPRLGPGATFGFLALSNLWLVPAAVLILVFHAQIIPPEECLEAFRTGAQAPGTCAD